MQEVDFRTCAGLKEVGCSVILLQVEVTFCHCIAIRFTRRYAILKKECWFLLIRISDLNNVLRSIFLECQNLFLIGLSLWRKKLKLNLQVYFSKLAVIRQSVVKKTRLSWNNFIEMADLWKRLIHIIYKVFDTWYLNRFGFQDITIKSVNTHSWCGGPNHEKKYLTFFKVSCDYESSFKVVPGCQCHHLKDPQLGCLLKKMQVLQP